ncbi:unnamed protein product [Malus baccata var. baccata]
MADSGGLWSKRVQGEASKKDKKKKRVAACVRYISSAKSRYQITYAELVGYQKSDMVNKFRGDIRVLARDRCRVNWKSWRDVPNEIKTIMIDALVPDWDVDKSDVNMMKCIDIVFKYRFRKLKFDVERDAERHGQTIIIISKTL